MSKIKIGVIGLGGISQVVHLPYLSKFSDVEISAIADISKSSLKSCAQKFSIKNTYSDYTKMIEEVEMDAVIIATPTSTHKDIAIDCMNKNMHVLIEKPMSRTIDEAVAIVKASEKNNVLAMAGMNMRYRPDMMLLKSIISSGEIGDPFIVKCGWYKLQSSQSKWLTKKKESGGGVIFDLGIVMLDLALWLTNFPALETVSTKNYYHKTFGVEDTSISFIRCKPDTLIYMDTSWSMISEKDTFFLDIYGQKGNAFVNPLRINKKMSDGTVLDMTPTGSPGRGSLYKKSYENELKSFIGAVRGINPMISPAEESISRLQIIERMYKSASLEKEVKV